MTTVGNLLGLGSAVGAATCPGWRWPFMAACAAGVAIALWFSHRADSPRRNRFTAWGAAALAVAVTAWSLLR